MVFPQTPLPIKAEIMVGSTWTDVTGDVRAGSQIRITRGRSDEGQTVDTTRCQFVLDNNTGKYTPKNPAGPYFGQIGRNTPCRVSVMTGTPYLDLPGGVNDYAETPDTAALDITGDLDIRLDASWSNWIAPIDSQIADTVEMMAKFNGPSQKSWMLGSRLGRLYFEWSPDGTTSLSASSTLPPVIPGAGGRLAVRATLDVNNGAGGNTVRFFVADTLDGEWVQLGDPIVQAGTTSIFNSAAPLRIGQATNFNFRLPVGKVHAAEIRNGLWGTVVAQPRFDQQAVGAASFADSAGRTWTVNANAAITNRRTRFVGEISAWSVRWESRHDVVTQVEASGVMRRLTQGASPIRSAMYRELTNPSRTSIVAYLPMEDEASATAFASGLNGQPTMPVPAGVTLASYSDWAASAPLPVFTFGTAKARVAPYAATNAIFARFFVAVPAGGVTGVDRLFSFTTTGTARAWSLFVNPAGSLDLRAYDADGTQLMATAFSTFQVNGAPRHFGIELTQVGADISWKLIVFKIDESRLSTLASGFTSGTLTGQTAGAATEVRIGQDGLLNGTAIGHIALSSSTAGFASTGGAMVAWREETTSGRINRLGLEEGIPAYSASVSDQQMGIQGMATLMDLMREAEAADEGILCEERTFLGLRFRDHTSLYNQPAALTLNYSGSDGLVTPLEPTEDDQQSRNDITVSRAGGSSTRLTLDTGSLSTQAPPNGIGRYPDSVTRNVATDAQTGEHAGWLLHLATWDETRYPVVRMMLAKAPGLIEAAAAVDIGDRVQVTNPPSWLPPDDIGLMVQGYSETLDQFTWNLDFNCTPAGPWDVAWAGDDVTASAAREFAWVDADGSSLAEDLTTTETDVDILTLPGNTRWTPNVSDTPFDWQVAGEVMTVTAPGNLQVTNPFFDTDLTGWSGASSSLSRSTAIVHPHPRAKGSMRVVPAGGIAAVSGRSDLTPVGSIVPGQQYRISAWVYSINGWTALYPSAQWADSGGSVLSSTGTSRSVTASVWTYIEDVVTAPANASRVRMAVRADNTPATSDIYYAWAPRITRLTSSWLHDTFSRTVSNGWATTDSGLLWSTVGGGAAGDYSVGSGYGVQVLSTLDVSRRTAVTAVNPDFDIYCDITTSALATGDSLYGGVTARMLDASNMYLARMEFTTSNAIIMSVRKIVADVQTSLGTFTLPFTHTAATFVRARFQGSGTTLRAKAWRVGDQEPDKWHVDTTDGSITAANQIGTRSIRSTGNTNTAAVEIRYDNFEVVNPQTFTVARSQNRVVKSHSAGADVRLAYPAYTAL